MSLAHDLARILTGRGRSNAAVSRAELELDAGAMMTPADFPYPTGARPLPRFAARVAVQGQGPRPLGQLYPPTGNPTQRRHAHVDYIGRAVTSRAAAADAAGASRPAKITRTRPWLFAGSSSASASDRAAASVPASLAAPAGGCEGC